MISCIGESYCRLKTRIPDCWNYAGIPPRWVEALPGLLDDFSNLLRDALDLLRELGGANDNYDPSVVWRPSISNHSQNTYTRDWTVLIDLTRDAWLATAEVSPERARLAAGSLAFHAVPIVPTIGLFRSCTERNHLTPTGPRLAVLG